MSRIFQGAKEAAGSHGDEAEDPYLDLFYAPATPRFESELFLERAGSSLASAEHAFLSFDSDQMWWWEDENYDLVVHMPMSQLREFLSQTSSYPPDQPLVEGMVFVELSRSDRVRFVQFSLQARNESREIFRRLLREKPEEPEGGA